MSRIGYIQKELYAAQDEDRDPELSQADVRWAVLAERWDLLDQAGLDRDEAVQSVHGEDTAAPAPVFNTENVPTGGADNPSVVTEPTAASRQTVSPEDDDELLDYRDMHKADLVAEASARGLATSGNKDELIARLEANDAQQEQ
jgi:SAP domain